MMMAKGKAFRVDRRLLVVVPLVVFLVLVVGLYLAQEMNQGPTQLLVFHREPSSGPARDAIHSAELANYSEILQWTPYWGGENSSDIMIPEGFETWLNFINNDTLEFLVSRFRYIIKELPRISVRYEYEATAVWIANLTVQANVYGESIIASNQSMTISFPWDTHDYLHSSRWNSTGYAISSNPPRTEHFGDAYIVHMVLLYSDVVASRIYQYVVLNSTHQVLRVTVGHWGHMIE